MYNVYGIIHSLYYGEGDDLLLTLESDPERQYCLPAGMDIQCPQLLEHTRGILVNWVHRQTKPVRCALNVQTNSEDMTEVTQARFVIDE